MKIKLLLTLLVFFVGLTSTYASFPVERKAKTTSSITVSSDSLDEKNSVQFTSPATIANQDKWVGVALWFFLGLFAAHRWYYKKPIGWNILYIVTFGGLGIWAIIDLVNMLTDNF